MSEELGGYDRSAIFLGAASLVSAIFAFGADAPTPIDFAHVGAGGAIVLAGFGVVGLLGGLLHRGILSVIAGAGLTIAAVVQLVTLAISPRPLGGDATAMALFGAFGIGLLLVGFARRQASTPAPTDDSAPTTTTPTDDRKA
ncbi:Rv1678 family membrane protein [Agromyces bauzanensis]|uniref:Uncharacterized protein n=1 Tax=Agromyces bauzanensis TaxID=1308924 RepID=A0A917PLL7_9MICO|nr:hypothetical protein [Agromyces bauzanensis]GGJ82952.1 hypothetical protein GCM10011372_21550 [Agromyces bauzanensis]